MGQPSFEEIRLALVPWALSGTGAAGPCRLAFANDNDARLRLCPAFPNRVLRLAGRFALAQLRSIVHPGRAVLSAFFSNSFLVCQRRPSAVCVIASAYPPFVRSSHTVSSRFDAQSNTGVVTGVGQPISDLRKGASHDRRV